jgi:hypothetical protein
MAKFCTNCGAALVEGAKFCPSCGAPVVSSAAASAAEPAPSLSPTPEAAPQSEAAVPGAAAHSVTADAVAPPPAAPARATRTTAAPKKSKAWIAIPLLLIALGAIVWALLSGFPLGGEDDGTREVAPAESERPTPVERQASTGTIVETTAVTGAPNINELGVPIGSPESPATDGRGSAIPSSGPAEPPSGAIAFPPPSSPEEPARTDVPPPSPREEPSSASRSSGRGGEISGAEAVQVLDSFIVGNNPYDADLRCVEIRNLGYRNAGYTLQVYDDCGNRALGRWRVDALSREVFRQRSDGRYVRP